MEQQEINNVNENEPKNFRKSGITTAGMVLGIIGISLSFIPIVNNAAFVLGILAVIFGGISLVKRRAKGKAIAGLILGILAIVITIIMQMAALNAIDEAVNEINNEIEYMAGDKSDEILEKHLNVTFGKFQVISGEYYEETKLEATVTNKGDERKSFDVTVEAVDKNGNRIAVDYIYVSDLGVGQSQKIEIFDLVTSDKIPLLKKATFKIVEASMY